MDGSSECEEIRDSREVCDLYSYICIYIHVYIYMHVYIYIYIHYVSNLLMFLLNKVHYTIVYRVKV